MSTALQPYPHHYVGPAFAAARVHDVMRIGIVTCEPDTSLRDACRIMVSYQIHSLLVGNPASAGSPWGIVTDMDIAAAATSDSSKVTAADLASRLLITVPANETLSAAAHAMVDHKCSHLLAVQPETGRPVGVISALGIASVLAAGPA